MVNNSRNNRVGRSGGSRRSIKGTGSRNKAVPMARKKDIPPGKYTSKIEQVSFVKTLAGADAVQIVYTLTADNGSLKQMREVIPLESWAFECFCDALIAAGLEDGDDLEKAVGIVEEVTLEYPDSYGLGRFAKRMPIADTSRVTEKKTVSSTEVEDDDYDDFLEDEEW